MNTSLDQATQPSRNGRANVAPPRSPPSLLNVANRKTAVEKSPDKPGKDEDHKSNASLDWAENGLKRFNWSWLHAKLLHLLWVGPVETVFAVIYVALARIGFIQLTPMFAMRLSRMPGLGVLKQSEWLAQIDIALILSFFLFVVVSYCWSGVFRLWTSGDRSAFETEEPGYAKRYELLLIGLSLVVIASEFALFYLSIADSSWGGSSFSITALLASTVFVGVLLGVILIGIHLERKVSLLESKK